VVVRSTTLESISIRPSSRKRGCVLIQQYGDDAKLEAALRADEFLEDGDWLGSLVWQRILEAIKRLQAKTPAWGKAVH
jgi:hypothetical protein